MLKERREVVSLLATELRRIVGDRPVQCSNVRRAEESFRSLQRPRASIRVMQAGTTMSRQE
jgi:hypothetical protein